MEIKCTRCNWHKNKYLNNAPAIGNQNARVLIVISRVKAEAIKKQMLLSDLESEVLQRLLKHYNIPLADIAVASAMRCYKSLTSKPPTVPIMDKCFIHLNRDINKIQPNLVVSFGDIAYYQTTGLSTHYNAFKGHRIWSDKIQTNVLVLDDLSAGIKYNKISFPGINYLIQQGKRGLSNIVVGNQTKYYDYKLITSKTDFVRNIYPILKNAKVLCHDVESTGLSFFKDELTLLQFYTGEEPAYLITPDVAKACKKQLATLMRDSTFIGQNWKFDVKWMYALTNEFPEHWQWDTMLAEYVLLGVGGNDLTTLCGKYAPESMGYDVPVILLGGAQNAVKQLNSYQIHQYGTNDVGILPIIQDKQRKLLEKEGRLWAYENLVLPCSRVLTKMSCRGIMVDTTLLKQVDRKYEKKQNALFNQVKNLDCIKKCEEKFGKPFNPQSPDMIRWVCIDYYDLPVLKTTAKNNPSIGEKEMEIYAEKYKNPYCLIMSNYRSIATLRNNFCGGLLDKLNYNIAHTTYGFINSGRPNSKDPNLLNIPSNKDIKSCFIARPGHEFVYGDESQVEVRVGAVVYDEQKLIDSCNAGGDFHSRIACNISKDDYEDFYRKYKEHEDQDNPNKWPEIVDVRSKAKRVTFGIFYQMGAQKLAYELGISLREAERFIDEYFNSYPDLKKNIDATKKHVIEYGYVDTWFGFRRWWKEHTEDDHNTQREAVNHKVQGTAWNLMQLALIQIDATLRKEKMKSQLVMQVYDSAIVEARLDETEDVRAIMKEIMEGVNKPFDGLNRVKLKTDIKTGLTLAEF